MMRQKQSGVIIKLDSQRAVSYSVKKYDLGYVILYDPLEYTYITGDQGQVSKKT